MILVSEKSKPLTASWTEQANNLLCKRDTDRPAQTL